VKGIEFDEIIKIRIRSNQRNVIHISKIKNLNDRLLRVVILVIVKLNDYWRNRGTPKVCL